MRVLVVATNATRSDLAEHLRAGRHHRVDYLELAGRFGTPHVDYGVVKPNELLHKVEGLSRLDLRQALAVAGMAHQNGYDVVLSLSERVGIPLALVLDRTVRHVVLFHHGMSRQKLRLIKALGLHKRWDRIAAISRAEAQGMQDYLGLEQGQVVALHTPVDTSFYQPRAEAAGRGQAFIQSLGLSYRDYPTLIRAMQRLPQIACQLRVGSTWVTGKAGHEHERLPPNVSLQPFVPPHVLRDCYAESRFIVVPIVATTQWSAGCTSVQTAQAMGKPVIATRLPGLSEYLLDGETGLLVDPGDDRAMAEAIALLWYDAERRARMGAQAREWIVGNFSLESWLERVSALCLEPAAAAHRRESVCSS
jgi:glycosyltransferase involved in cell wall biosynthesis